MQTTTTMKQQTRTVLVALLFILPAFIGLWFSNIPITHAASNILVNSNDDSDDGTCDVTHCSLREAIALANSQPLTDTISFDPTITPTIMISGVLPAITDTVVLNGDVNGAKMVLGGTNSTADGLILNADNSTIRNLVIHSFAGSGLIMNGSGNEIAGNIIGLDPTGQIDMGNGLRGIHLQSGGYNQIGGTTEAGRNIISGNTTTGIWLDGSDVFSNTIQGNFIGTNVSGTVKILNSNHGIAISDSGYNLIGGTVGNTLGGACTGACNLISGNGNGSRDSGIYLDDSGADYNRIVGNYIGTDVSGTQDLGNRYGIYTYTGGNGADYLQIGGSTPAERNIISGNNIYGIYLSADSNFTTIQGNFIGTGVTGMVTVGNSQHGIFSNNSKSTLLGGTEGTTPGGACTGVCNLISGNGSTTSHHGVFFDGFPNDPVVQGNFFGLDVTGMNGLGNAGIGLRLEAELSMLVGGDTPGARNVFAGNGSHGFHAGITSVTTSAIVRNNYAGINSAGTAAIPNGNSGMVFSDCYHCVMSENVLSGNDNRGMYSSHSTVSGVVYFTIQNNLIGVLPDGVTPMGNGGVGIELYGSSFVNERTRYHIIGGLNEGEGNVIANNDSHGIHMSNKRIRDNVIQGNFIGTDATSTLDIGNAGHGIFMDYEFGYNSSQNQIEENFIVNNDLDGIAIIDRPFNNIRRNTIYNNGGLGIDLQNDGVTANDIGDVDLGGNRSMNYPEIVSAWNRAGGTRIAGTFHTISNTFATLDFYASTLCDASGYGEGERYLGSVEVVTNDLGNVNFTELFALVPAGEFVAATATDLEGNTSEFSECQQVTAASGAIVGTVSNQLPVPMVGAEVTLYENLGTVVSPTWSLLDVVTVAVDGGYEMPALYTGEYALRVTDPNQVYAPQYYSGVGQWDAITPISVTDGVTTTSVNMVLEVGGEITGTVTLTDGTPLAGIVVVGLRENAGIWEIANSATTDISGTYTIGGLAGGDYRAYFYDTSGMYGSEYYSDTTSFDSADIFTVTVATTTPNINAVLDNLVPIMPVGEGGNGNCVIRIDENGQWVVRIRKAGSRMCQTLVETPPGLVSCSGVDVPSGVAFVVGTTVFNLVESGGIWTGLVTINGNGNPDLRLTWDCGGNPNSVPIGGVQLYDPSGFITDAATGAPIAEATVTLYQVPNWRAKLSPGDDAPHTCQSNLSKAVGDPWNQPAPTALGQFAPPVSSFISPTINAQLTDHEGYYGWDVAAGCWYVAVQAAGYIDLVSPVVGVPTEVTDLDLQMVAFAVDVDVVQGVGDSLDLSWQPNFPTSCTYNLYQGNTPYFDPADGTLLTSTATQTANVDGVVGDPTTNYFFRVEAVGCTGAGDVASGVVGAFDFGIISGSP